MLPADPMMTATFVGTLVLTDAQIAALRRPVLDTEVEWRPLTDGGPLAIPYLSHNGYRDRLDAAFGLGGWGMVPVGMPKEKDEIVYVPFALVVGGVPRVYAWGEQRYFETNREGKRSQMTYGDALEGAKSSAITRCGKELGIARELWDRRYLRALKARLVDQGGETRRREGPDPTANELITDFTRGAGSDRKVGQVQRLWMIIRKSGRSEGEIKAWLAVAYGIDSTKKIRRRDYEAICAAVEAPGPLPEPTRREPGEDDQ